MTTECKQIYTIGGNVFEFQIQCNLIASEACSLPACFRTALCRKKFITAAAAATASTDYYCLLVMIPAQLSRNSFRTSSWYEWIRKSPNSVRPPGVCHCKWKNLRCWFERGTLPLPASAPHRELVERILITLCAIKSVQAGCLLLMKLLLWPCLCSHALLPVDLFPAWEFIECRLILLREDVWRQDGARGKAGINLNYFV